MNGSAEVVLEPKTSDILCGKDKSCVSHEGSVRFRKMIDEYRERYCSDSTSKQQRMSITKEIVQRLTRSSRFLKYDRKDKAWKTISALAARDKVSHALRFANLRENRKTGKAKNAHRHVSVTSTSSNSKAKVTSPEDTKLWNSLVTRQTNLLECIKRGERGSVPAIVALPEGVAVVAMATEGPDCNPLSIDDISFETNSIFQNYDLEVYRSEDSTEGGCNRVRDYNTEETNTFKHSERHGKEHQTPDSQETKSRGVSRDKWLCEEQSECDYSPSNCSNGCDSEDGGDEIATMITEPLMEWDLEHGDIFEV